MTPGKRQWTIGTVIQAVLLAGAVLGAAGGFMWWGGDMSRSIKTVAVKAESAGRDATMALKEGAVVKQALTSIKADVTIIRAWIERQ